MSKTENREVKSDAFSMLMENKVYALEVYNALNGSCYTDPELVEIVTLKKGISLSVRNDAAIIVDEEIGLYEHQSTYSPNVPLRLLIYLVDILKPMIASQDIYGRSIVQIPTPRFAVFYNGQEERPEVEILKLSSAFQNPIEHPEIELTCTVYNINPGNNLGLMDKCPVLREYTEFVEKVRYYQRLDKKEPVRQAVEYCIKHNILKEFLQLRGDEVIKNMVLDYTVERRIELMRNEYMQKGMQKLLINLIMKKISEQKSLEEIVLDLGEEQSVVEPFYHLIQDNPGKTVDELLEIYNSK